MHEAEYNRIESDIRAVYLACCSFHREYDRAKYPRSFDRQDDSIEY